MERRRRLRRLAWGALLGLGLAVAGVVLWEVWASAGVRLWGYVALGVAVVVGVLRFVFGWRASGVGVKEMAGAVERAFPQARGAVRDAMGAPAGALGAARVESARAWMERRGLGRLDAAVGERERSRIARWRSAALAVGVFCVAVAVAQPAAARRAIQTMTDPASLWRSGTWRVEPGDARVEAGGSVDGRAEFAGAGRDAALVLEWRPGGGAWRAETLADAPRGRWRWTGLESSRSYRVRYGGARSPEYAVEVAPRFAVVEARARDRDGTWEPLAGRVLPADEPVEIEGRANAAIASVVVEVDERIVAALSTRGNAFSGTVTLPAGTGRLRVTGARDTVAAVGPFAVAGAGRAYVVVVAPAEEIVALRGASAWVEARAGAPAGLAWLRWETDDGRTGPLGDPAGARDTTLAGVVPLGAGHAPGDTVAWRIAALPAAGAAAATPWRRAVLPAERSLRREAAAERERAERAVENALDRAEEAARGGGDAAEADRALRAAADSLARAVDRTLADPGLAPEVARDLRAQRELLDRAASELSPRAGLDPSPEAAAEARAAILEAVRDRLEALERALARSGAADSLERLAEEQRGLAETTRETGADELDSAIGPRQEAIDQAAREALAEAIGEDPGTDGGPGEQADRAEAGGREAPAEERGADEPGPDERGADERGAPVSQAQRSARDAGAALDAAAEAIRSGTPDQAAEAQDRAASGMQSAASTARDEARREAAGMAADRAALDRAGAEALFLADRQRTLADDVASGDGPPPDATARQDVVTGGLERTLQAMVAGLGGVPAGAGTADAIGEAVQATMYARRAVADRSVDPSARRTALSDAADALAALARALLLPDGSSGASGQAGQASAAGSQGAAARELESLAEAQRALADALGASEQPAGGNPDAAEAQREIGQGLERIGRALEEAGMDAAAVEALRRSVEESATRLERGLPGARSRTELRALARRLSDLGRMLDDRSREERRSETARSFVPVDPDPLPPRATARRLDAASALEPWRADLPLQALEPARRYLEALEEAGVRASSAEDAGAPSPEEGSP